jgi:hypothetical protein
MTEPGTQRSFVDRLMGAIKLDAGVYSEIEHDPAAMGQAGVVVVLASLAAGIGSGVQLGATGLIAATIGGLIGWAVSTAVVWLIGVQIMKHTSDYNELLRTLGFASAPRLIGVLGVIPGLGIVASLVAGILGLVAYVVAVREALDVTTGRAIFVCVLAYLVAVAVVVVMVALTGGAPAGPAV